MKKEFRKYVKPEHIKLQNIIAPIYIRYDYDRIKRTFINTGEKINVSLFWDAKKNTIKRACPNQEQILSNIKNLENKISNIIQHAKQHNLDATCEFVIDRLRVSEIFYFDNNKQTDFFESLNKFIQEREDNASVSEHSIRDYKSLRKHLLAFEKYWKRPLSFSILNIVFYEKFVYYLTYKAEKPDKTIGLKLNSIGKQIKNLKVFYNDRKLKDNLPIIDLSSFKKKNEIVDHIYLPETEINLIWNLDLSNFPELISSRDLLVFGCYTGLRYSDITSLKPYHFKQIVVGNEIQTAIVKTQQKVNERVEIALIHLAKEVSEKYNYELPKIHMNDFNERIKKIGELAGLKDEIAISHKIGNNIEEEVSKKFELLSSHVCRRSFATNMYLRGIDPEVIMTNTGHKSFKTLFAYIKITKSQKAFMLYDYFKSTDAILRK